MISNIRCLNRQKSFIKAIEFKGSTLVCAHFNGKKAKISYDNLVYSFREIKFEKDKSEIEIKEKKRITNKLIGRLNIKDWQTIFEIKKRFSRKENKTNRVSTRRILEQVRLVFSRNYINRNAVDIRVELINRI